MSRRRPWEEPIVYEEDRFPEKPSRTLDVEVGGSIIKPDPDLVLGRIQEAAKLPNATTPRPKPKPARPVPETSSSHRPSWRDAGGGRSNDDRPLDYGRGPHDREIDVDDRDEFDD